MDGHTLHWGSGGRCPPAAGGHGSEHLFVWAYRFCASWLRPQRRLEWLDPDLVGFEGLEYETYATGGSGGRSPPAAGGHGSERLALQLASKANCTGDRLPFHPCPRPVDWGKLRKKNFLCETTLEKNSPNKILRKKLFFPLQKFLEKKFRILKVGNKPPS